LEEFGRYVENTHQSNLSEIDEATKRDPAKTLALQTIKRKLNQAAEELRDNVIQHPGLPARLSKEKYKSTP
jgi:hypothetical protein